MFGGTQSVRVIGRDPGAASRRPGPTRKGASQRWPHPTTAGRPLLRGPAPETSTRRARRQSQLDFELEFLGAVLDRDPLYADALKVHADNLAAKGYYHRALQADRRLVRLRPDRPIPWYNLACSYAVLGMTDPAFAALERALRLGYRHSTTSDATPT